MGEEVARVEFTSEDRRRYREKVKRCLDALRRMLDDGHFETGRRLMGVELEIYVADRLGSPMMVNQQILDRLESADFQTEVAQFNLEFNLAPHALVATVFRELEEELRTSLNFALRRAEEIDAHLIIVGILPTLRDLHINLENISANPRYKLLNDQILAQRGEDVRIEIEGPERLTLVTDSIMMEAASTSMQLHLQVDPDDFARYWNAAQAVSAIQLAAGANSPFLLGKELWRETRIALFEQSIDTRTEEFAAQGVRPRVWFGEKWIDGVVDLFDENVRYFPSLLPLLDDEDPLEALDQGNVPHLRELTLHNGTVWRWNRPVYGVARGKPHLRVENRVLPAGPSVVDEVANAAFYYGLLRTVADDLAVSQRMSFATATDNFFSAAREGIDAQQYWPGVGAVPASELILRHLLPLAHEGLDRWAIDSSDRDRYLGIIEDRAKTGITGATWQVATVRHLHDGGMDRGDALLEMTRRYIEHMHANMPVHTWPVP